MRANTLYVATTGGMGPLTLACLHALLQDLATCSDGVLVAATDADAAGKRFAERLEAMAKAAGVRSERLAPPVEQNDWNKVIQQKWGNGA